MANASIAGRTDPIFAAIRRSKEARLAHTRALRTDDDEAKGAMCVASMEADDALYEVVPESLGGVLAYLRFLQRPYIADDLERSSQIRSVLNALLRSPVLSDPVEDKEAVAAFNTLYYNWWMAQCACCDPSYDDSQETTDRLCGALSAAEDALRAAPTPTKGQLKHKFHYLDFSMEESNNGDVEAALASIKEDLRRFGFDLPAVDRR